MNPEALERRARRLRPTYSAHYLCLQREQRLVLADLAHQIALMDAKILAAAGRPPKDLACTAALALGNEHPLVKQRDALVALRRRLF